MMKWELAKAVRESRDARAALRKTVERTKRIKNEYEMRCKSSPKMQRPTLLMMSEGLIAAHRAAKIDGDGYTLDLIEDALFHVGKRLAKEVGDGRSRLSGYVAG